MLKQNQVPEKIDKHKHSTQWFQHRSAQTHSPLALNMPSFAAPLILGNDSNLMLEPDSDCSRHHMHIVSKISKHVIFERWSHYFSVSCRVESEEKSSTRICTERCVRIKNKNSGKLKQWANGTISQVNLKFLPACVRRVVNSWFNNALAKIVKRHKSDVGHQNLHSTWEHWSPNMKRLHVMVRWPDQSEVIICKICTCSRSHRQSHPLRRILQQQGLSQSLRRNQKTVSGRGSAVDIASRPEDQKGNK